jgi:hypothetical protein
LTSESSREEYYAGKGFARKSFLGDTAIASTKGFNDIEIDRIRKKFGQKTLTEVSAYQVIEMELSFYYLCDNYEKKNINYRAIPRLRSHDDKPREKYGKIGSITFPIKTQEGDVI